jgi:hypothetical protein
VFVAEWTTVALQARVASTIYLAHPSDANRAEDLMRSLYYFCVYRIALRLMVCSATL